MKLKTLLKNIEIINVAEVNDLEINKIVYHSQKVEKGDLFVCVKGYKTNGHKYINNAIENGAIGFVVEDFQEDLEYPQFVVKDSRKALAALGDAYYDCPSRKMEMIGITASNGKTTTSFMVNDILEKQGLNTGLIGTVMVKYGDYSKASYLTTPESLDLHHYLYNMKNSNVSHVCMEVSSSALELSRVGNVDFDIVTLNNISREHIDLHGSFENYYNAKASLIREASEKQIAILNLDDPYSKRLMNETKAQVITYGIDDDSGDLSCKDVDINTGRGVFTVEIKKSIRAKGITIEPCEFEIQLRTPGYHTIYNALVAISIGLLNGVSVGTIQESLSSFGGVERRFEIIFEERFKIIDDHFANNGNITATFNTLNRMDFNHLKLVYAIRGSRGRAVISEAADAIVEWSQKLDIKKVIATLSRSHVTWKDEVTKEELDIFMNIMDYAGIEVELYEELDDAIHEGLKTVGDGDVLMLAGCQGMDFGGKIALNEIHRLRPDIAEDILFAPLKNRVAGV